MNSLALRDSGHTWRFCGVCRVLNEGHDYDPAHVRELFDKAAAWITGQNVHDDSDGDLAKAKQSFNPKTDYAQAYLDSLDKEGVEPAIPDYVRLFCAQEAQLTLVVSAPATAMEGRSATKKRLIPKNEPVRQHRPSVAMRS